MSISDYKPSVSRLYFKDSKGKEIPGKPWIDVVGEHSKQYKEYRRSRNKANIEMAVQAQVKAFEVSEDVESEEYKQAHEEALREIKKEVYTDEFLAEIGARSVAACIVDWDEEWFEEPFSKENVLELCRNIEFDWIWQQVARHIQNEENFFRHKKNQTRKVSKSSKGSKSKG